jgi:hypothetical protein
MTSSRACFDMLSNRARTFPSQGRYYALRAWYLIRFLPFRINWWIQPIFGSINPLIVINKI